MNVEDLPYRQAYSALSKDIVRDSTLLPLQINAIFKGMNTVLTKRDNSAMHSTRPVVNTNNISARTIRLDR
jgi:hypothetical protein